MQLLTAPGQAVHKGSSDCGDKVSVSETHVRGRHTQGTVMPYTPPPALHQLLSYPYPGQEGQALPRDPPEGDPGKEGRARFRARILEERNTGWGGRMIPCLMYDNTWKLTLPPRGPAVTLTPLICTLKLCPS